MLSIQSSDPKNASTGALLVSACAESVPGLRKSSNSKSALDEKSTPGNDFTLCGEIGRDEGFGERLCP
jgi:hypothetical protein